MGKKAAVEIVLQDFTGAASGFFGNTRTAASLVLGSSLGALFVLSNFSSSQNQRTWLEQIMIRAYRMWTWTAFVLSLNAVITCTVATSRILYGNFNAMAETPHQLLQREFEYEFVFVQWSMLMALLLLLVIVTIRLVLEFRLLSDPDRRDTAKFVVLSAVALLAHLLSYINASLSPWNNLFDMTLGTFRVVFLDTLNEPSLMKIVSIMAAVGAIYFSVRSGLTTTTSASTTSSDKSSKSKDD